MRIYFTANKTKAQIGQFRLHSSLTYCNMKLLCEYH